MPRTAARSYAHENTQLFREAVDTLAFGKRVSRTRVFKDIATRKNTTVHWVRERYYGGQVPTAGEVAWLRILASDPISVVGSNSEHLHAVEKLLKIQTAVSRFCYSCAGEPVNSKDARCWDAGCPLRIVSPLPLKEEDGS